MSLFTENDVRLLDKTLIIREQIIDNLKKGEPPTKARDIDAYVNLLESVDRSILAKAKVKVEESANKTNEETKAILKGLLMELHAGSNNIIEGQATVIRDVPEYQPGAIDVNPGELISRSDNIDINALLSSNETE